MKGINEAKGIGMVMGIPEEGNGSWQGVAGAWNGKESRKWG